MASMIISKVIYWFTLVLILSTTVYFGASGVKRVTYPEMAKRFQDFRCGKPRPRSFRVAELYPDIPESGISPPRIVLYRCEDSLGCCNAGSTCAVRESEPVSIELSLFLANIQKLITRDAEDHISCYCTSTDDRIK
ncbi:hypothetical protein Trydic_g16036 [Trypoxylus dichotomus]